MTMARDQAVQLMARALETDPATVDGRTALGVTPNWNSLAHVRLVLLLEERLGRRLEPATIVGLKGFEDVVALLEDPQRGGAATKKAVSH